MKPLGLRSLILVSVLPAVLVALATLAVFLDLTEQANRIRDIDAELTRAERVRGGSPPSTEDGGALDTDLVAGPVQLLVDRDGNVDRRSRSGLVFPPSVISEIVATEGNVTTSDPRYRVRVASMPDGRVSITALSLADFDAAVARFRTALLGGSLAILLLVAGVLWLLADRLSRPVVRMAEAASRIASGDLATPVTAPSGPRETVELATDLDRMVSELRGAIDRSDRARRGTERLLADLAHEIRTPLTALKGYSDLHAKGMLETSDDIDRAMARIGSESQRLSDLATGMLQLAREGQVPRSSETVDVAELVADVASDLRAAHPEQVIEITGERNLPLVVTGNREALHQALLNLGSNGCRHSPQGKPLEMRVGSRGDLIAVAVVDHGAGVAPDHRHQIFEPFFRTDNARNRDADHGAGLGLALSRRIAEHHGGTITVDTTPGGGATFTLLVAPISTAEVPVPPSAAGSTTSR